jgi:hypothetical protein
MPMMDIGHVSMLMLGLGMFMLMGVCFLVVSMGMEIIVVTMNVLMHHWHMDVKMGMFFISQHEGADDH